ncbi:MAG TPA: GxxExxY protein [Phycisphaerales bacterium]|nr:GxxExxY protein [Phycisphaerales bacterium]
MTTAAFKHRDLTDRIIGVFYAVYKELGSGFLESVYEHSMAVALAQAGIASIRQCPLQVHFRGQIVGEFRVDIIVENAVIMELKSARTICREHEAQVLNYLRASTMEVALILNFGPRPELRRLAYENTRKCTRALASRPAT